MRILFVHSPSDLYGASRSLLRLSTRLTNDNHQVLVILNENGPLERELIKNGIEVDIQKNLFIITRQKFKKLFQLVYSMLILPISVFNLFRIIQKFNPQIIHTNTALILSPCIAAKIKKTPHVWHIREFFSEYPNFWKFYQWIMYFFSQKIICVSNPVAEQFNSKLRRKNKIVVIHNGFPVNEFHLVDNRRVNAFCMKFGLNNHLVVGVVGRIKFQRKGQDIFIKAISLLKNKFSNVKYLLIGSPFPGNEQHLEQLNELIKKLKVEDSVVYTGDVEDIKAAYQALDVSVLPSALPEPFGGVVIESMAMGKPVIGTKIGGTIEQIDDDKNGFLVEPNNPKELAYAIERLLVDENMRKNMGDESRKRYLKLFEFENFYTKIKKVYLDMLSFN